MKEEPATHLHVRRTDDGPRRRPLGRRIAAWTALLIVAAFLLLVTQTFPAVLLFLWHTLLGWALHSYRLIDNVEWNATTLVLSASSLAGGCWVFHRLRASLAERGANPGTTMRIVAILLCGGAAAIATSGVMHQLAWLAQKPVFGWTNSRALKDAPIKFRRLLPMIQSYFEKHRRYPGTLADLQSDFPDLKRDDLFYRTSYDPDSIQPIIYLRPSLPDGEAVKEEAMLLVAPHGGYGRTSMAGIATGDVLMLPPSEFEKRESKVVFPKEDSP